MHGATITNFIGNKILTLTIKIFIFYVIADKGVGRMEILKHCEIMRVRCLKNDYIDVHSIVEHGKSGLGFPHFCPCICDIEVQK